MIEHVFDPLRVGQATGTVRLLMTQPWSGTGVVPGREDEEQT